MLSLQFIREHETRVREAMAHRHADPPLDEILEVDRHRREMLQEVEALRGQRNQLTAQISAVREPETRQRLIDQTRELSTRLNDLEPAAKVADDRLAALLLQVPNLPDDTVPIGRDESENPELRRWGTPRAFDFEVRPHWEIGESLGIIDSERGAKLAGSRFQVLMGNGAALSRALIAFMLDLHIREHDYIEIAPPYLVRPEIMVGTGQLPKFADEAYYLERDDLYLIPTAEVPVTNLHRGEILEPGSLPIRYCAYTPCFRREAGAAGRDTRGLIRVHQFDKVEMVKLVRPEESAAELENMVADATEVLERLGLPYRVIVLCTGDLGFAMAKTYDLEVWMPGQDRYVEISSCSMAGDFQARRADIKFRPSVGAHVDYVHTLNGSGLAVGRTMAAILETYQREDGSVEVPEALRPFLGGKTELRRALPAPKG
ncbi:MAG: serine--tRNA ligase [Chloroflexi bacterium]|nr:serine--tRNA ligase [Chloroflexota bacterium]